MMILRKGHKSKYTVIDNMPLQSSNLSLKARGMLVTLLSFPDDWKFNQCGLKEFMTDKTGSIRSALQELEDAGYLDRRQPKRDDGTFGDWEWFVFETPYAKKPLAENPISDNPISENSQLQSNKEQSTNRQSTKEDIMSGKPDHADEIAEIVEYLNSKLGTSYKPKSKDTASKINARLDEGFTVSDFKAVIDSKVSQWGHDPKMREYLRPVTLFAPSKFEGYLQATRMGEVEVDDEWAKYR